MVARECDWFSSFFLQLLQSLAGDVRTYRHAATTQLWRHLMTSLPIDDDDEEEEEGVEGGDTDKDRRLRHLLPSPPSPQKDRSGRRSGKTKKDVSHRGDRFSSLASSSASSSSSSFSSSWGTMVEVTRAVVLLRTLHISGVPGLSTAKPLVASLQQLQVGLSSAASPLEALFPRLPPRAWHHGWMRRRRRRRRSSPEPSSSSSCSCSCSERQHDGATVAVEEEEENRKRRREKAEADAPPSLVAWSPGFFPVTVDGTISLEAPGHPEWTVQVWQQLSAILLSLLPPSSTCARFLQLPPSSRYFFSSSSAVRAGGSNPFFFPPSPSTTRGGRDSCPGGSEEEEEEKEEKETKPQCQRSHDGGPRSAVGGVCMPYTPALPPRLDASHRDRLPPSPAREAMGEGGPSLIGVGVGGTAHSRGSGWEPEEYAIGLRQWISWTTPKKTSVPCPTTRATKRGRGSTDTPPPASSSSSSFSFFRCSDGLDRRGREQAMIQGLTPMDVMSAGSWSGVGVGPWVSCAKTPIATTTALGPVWGRGRGARREVEVEALPVEWRDPAKTKTKRTPLPSGTEDEAESWGLYRPSLRPFRLLWGCVGCSANAGPRSGGCGVAVRQVNVTSEMGGGGGGGAASWGPSSTRKVACLYYAPRGWVATAPWDVSGWGPGEGPEGGEGAGRGEGWRSVLPPPPLWPGRRAAMWISSTAMGTYGNRWRALQPPPSCSPRAAGWLAAAYEATAIAPPPFSALPFFSSALPSPSSAAAPRRGGGREHAPANPAAGPSASFLSPFFSEASPAGMETNGGTSEWEQKVERRLEEEAMEAEQEESGWFPFLVYAPVTLAAFAIPPPCSLQGESILTVMDVEGRGASPSKRKHGPKSPTRGSTRGEGETWNTAPSSRRETAVRLWERARPFPPTAHPFPRPPLPRCRCPSFPNPTTRIRRAMCHLSLRVVVVVVLLLLLLLFLDDGSSSSSNRRKQPYAFGWPLPAGFFPPFAERLALVPARRERAKTKTKTMDRKQGAAPLSTRKQREIGRQSKEAPRRTPFHRLSDGPLLAGRFGEKDGRWEAWGGRVGGFVTH